jgi:hypothetical protein
MKWRLLMVSGDNRVVEESNISYTDLFNLTEGQKQQFAGAVEGALAAHLDDKGLLHASRDGLSLRMVVTHDGADFLATADAYDELSEIFAGKIRGTWLDVGPTLDSVGEPAAREVPDFRGR